MNSVFHSKEKFAKSYTKKDGYSRLNINEGVRFNEKKKGEEQKSSTAKTEIFLQKDSYET